MADDNVFTIRLEEALGQAPSVPAPPARSQPTPPASPPPAPPVATPQRAGAPSTKQDAEPTQEEMPLPRPRVKEPKEPAEFNAEAEARKLLDLEERRKQVDEARLRILKEQGKLKEEQARFDPEAEAKRLLELEERRNAILQARARIVAAQQPPRDIQAEAQERVKQFERKREEKQHEQAVNAEVRRQRPDLAPQEKAKDTTPDIGKIISQLGFSNIGRMVQAIQRAVEALRPEAPTEYKPFREIPAPAGTVTQTSPPPPQATTVTQAKPAAPPPSPPSPPKAVQFSASAPPPPVQAPPAAAPHAPPATPTAAAPAVATVAAPATEAGVEAGAVEAGGALSTLAAVALPVGIALAAAGAAVYGFKKAVDSFVERGRELAKYSGPVAGAVAGADIKSLLADIREARTLSPELTELIRAQSDASNEFRELVLPIKKFVIGELATTLRGLTEIVKNYGPSIGVIEKLLEYGIPTALKFLGTAGYILSATLSFIKSEADKKKKEEKPDEFNWSLVGLDEAITKMSDWATIDKSAVKRAADSPTDIPAFRRY